MTPKPKSDNPQYRRSEKLAGKVALITGGDRGIGRTVAIAYLNKHDAKQLVEAQNRHAVTVTGDIFHDGSSFAS